MTIQCTACDHVSGDVIDAWEHRQKHPWLPRAPIIGKGMLVSVVINGEVFTDRVTNVEFDPKTGRETMTVGQDPLPRALTSIQKMNVAMRLLFKPRRVPMWLWRVWLKIRK